MPGVGAALVTGGARRLGRTIALALGRGGYDTAVHFNTSSRAAEETAAEIRGFGVRSEVLQADLLDPCAASGLVGEARAALGRRIGVLVNNASIFEPDTIETATLESWRDALEINLHAPFLLAQAFARQAPKSVPDGDGELAAVAQIINLVDQRVVDPTPDFVSYSIAKSALWSFTRIAAIALAPDVRVNAIGPGPTVRNERQTAEHFAGQRGGTLLGRGANPEDISSAVNYLLNSKAITGQLLCVDGGQHLKPSATAGTAPRQGSDSA